MLLNRITKEGTIDEPTGKPDPEFTLPSTVHWMHALRLFVEDVQLNFAAGEAFYASQSHERLTPQVENTVLEQLFLSLHHFSALQQLRGSQKAADAARIGIITWYHGIVNAANAMVAAQSSRYAGTKAASAILWDREIALGGLAMAPFSWRVSSLVENTYKSEIDRYKGDSQGKLRAKPRDGSEARGAIAEYLSGSAAWYADYAKNEIMKTPEFVALGVENFRTKQARELRDANLSKQCIGFVHEASRYCGKASEREALFLAYGSSSETHLSGFAENLSRVLGAFLAMAGAFSKQKLGRGLWSEFVADVDAKGAFSARASQVWGN
ncbi:hypothetical protein IB270_33060 [Ensifer sp. ENS05]|uniref:hypothetical protein n=1 Tax=Ensifer sp. ENS05 TaxID=2769277 RepID=UPI0017836A65|nr:hypothetical protein [Ensifer sp. ENS05]MBD9597657.1 hypothetical protein [Ensifer sp. ENS05]